MRKVYRRIDLLNDDPDVAMDDPAAELGLVFGVLSSFAASAIGVVAGSAIAIGTGIGGVIYLSQKSPDIKTTEEISRMSETEVVAPVVGAAVGGLGAAGLGFATGGIALAALGVGSIIYLSQKSPDIKTTEEISRMSFDSNSMGINIPQVVVAGIEAAALNRGNIKNSALIAASVGLSNLVPAYLDSYSESTEKYLLEPIIAGALYALGSNFIKTGEKDSLMKNMVKGFLIGSSSAAVAGSVYGSTMVSVPPQSVYSAAAPGLRSAENAPSYPRWTVA